MGTIEILVLLFSFVALLAIGVPIAYSIGISGILTMLVGIDFFPALATFSQRMASGLNSFTLLAIPFFVLAGNIMSRGGIAIRLIDFARILVGNSTGGLAMVNVLGNMLFGSISGSSAAAASAIGSIMYPEMKKEGYSEEFSVAVNVTSATTGMSIPPSNTLIVYSLAAGGVSITALFLAGYLPGILTGITIMIAAVTMLAYKANGAKGALRVLGKVSMLIIGVITLYNIAAYSRANLSSTLNRAALITIALAAALFLTVKIAQNRQKTLFGIKKFLNALPSLLMLVIVIGGILLGIFTATEAAVIAVVYALILSFIYREIKIRDLYDIILRSVKTTGLVLLLVAASQGLSWIMAYQNIPQSISAGLLSLSTNPVIILLLINFMLLLVGMFMDMTPAILIFTPILLPIVSDMGMDPIHFGIIIVLNLSIGLCTPPVGSVLFVGCSIAGIGVDRVVKPMVPLFLSMIVVLLLVTYIPQISLWLPRLLGM